MAGQACRIAGNAFVVFDVGVFWNALCVTGVVANFHKAGIAIETFIIGGTETVVTRRVTTNTLIGIVF